MTNIPNTEYITIDKDGVFVGGVHATHYRGAKIAFIDDVKRFFNNIQKKYPSVRELHIGTFDTKGNYAEPGRPSGKSGLKAWCRVMFSDGKVGNWVFFRGTVPSFCAYNCSSFMSHMRGFCHSILGERGMQPKMVKISKPGCYAMVPESFLQKVK